ncbi:MAG: ABC transporter ATP-binding protein [Acidimicrobiales bacterium]
MSVHVGGRPILDDVSFSLAAGQLCGIVGYSGAGKTTLIGAIGGLVDYRGHIRLDDVPIDHLPTHKRGTVTLFQEPRLFDSMSLVDNVSYASRVRRVRRAKRIAEALELLAEVGLADRANCRPQGLSGGEQQRVALARALHAEPRVLLLDEPLTGVDGPRRDELRTLIGSLTSERGITTMLVSHDLSDALALADQLAVLIEGRLAQFETPDGVLHRPNSPAVAALTGNPNVLRGRAEHGVLTCGGRGIAVNTQQARATEPDELWTVRPERIGFASSGIPARVSWVDRRVTHTRVDLECPLGALVAVAGPGVALRAFERVYLTMPADALWRFPFAAEQS